MLSRARQSTPEYPVEHLLEHPLRVPRVPFRLCARQMEEMASQMAAGKAMMTGQASATMTVSALAPEYPGSTPGVPQMRYLLDLGDHDGALTPEYPVSTP